MASQLLNTSPGLSNLHDGDVLDFVWDNAVEGLAFVGVKGEWLAVNPKLAAWLGRTPTELQSMTWMDVTVGEDVAADLQAVGQVLAGHLPEYTMNKTYQPRHDRPFHARLTVRPWIDKEGNRVLFFLSQIQRLDPAMTPMPAEPDIAVVWRWCRENKWIIILAFVVVAFMGEGFIGSLDSAIEWGRALIGGTP